MKYYISGTLTLDRFTDLYRIINCVFRDEAHDRDLVSYYDLYMSGSARFKFLDQLSRYPEGQKVVLTMIQKKEGKFNFAEDNILSIETVKEFAQHYKAPTYEERLSLQAKKTEPLAPYLIEVESLEDSIDDLPFD